MAATDPIIKALLGVADGKQVRFDRFMDTVLYEPQLGYYARSSERAGRGGDFITSPEVSNLFAECVRHWIREAWTQSRKPKAFTVVEVGAGRGTLARDLMDSNADPIQSNLRFFLVERGTAPRDALVERFKGDPRVQVFPDIEELPNDLADGVFIANELFDNLPVRRLMRADGWKEIVVGIHGSKLREELVDAPADLIRTAEQQGIALAEGESAEVSQGAVPLLRSVLSRFRSGGLLVFDYGGDAKEVSGNAAPHGTLSAHRGHARHGDLYSSPGDQDITAHVNFTPLREEAERLGFGVRLDTQAQFLLGHRLAERVVERVEKEQDPFLKLRLSQFAKQLYHPEAMGGSFRVLHGMRPSVGQRH